MTRIDRYVLRLFLRTVLICFLSLAGIVIVFHAFTSMDDFAKQGETAAGGLPAVMMRFYGPYLLLLVDSTGAVITLMAFLFTVGWLRHSGELTSTLAVGVSHGRIFRPMVIAAIAIVLLQMVNREFILPHYSHRLTLNSKDIQEDREQPLLAQYDKVNRVLVDGKSLIAARQKIVEPSFRIDGDYPGLGDNLAGESAVWMDHFDGLSGYLVEGIRIPSGTDSKRSLSVGDRKIFLFPSDTESLKPGQCFFATSLHVSYLQKNRTVSKLASLGRLAERVQNPAVHSSAALQVLVHARMVRVPLDIALICLVLPLATTMGSRPLVSVMATALFTVLAFFVLKSASTAVGSGYLISPALAGWLPLLIVGPIGYARWKHIQVL